MKKEKKMYEKFCSYIIKLYICIEQKNKQLTTKI